MDSVEDWRYDGLTLRRDGKPVVLAPGGSEGAISYLSYQADALEIFGWAIDTSGPRKVDSILVFAGEQLIHQGVTDVMVAETNLFGVVVPVGFQFVIPNNSLGGNKNDEIRIFAVSADGSATELKQQ